MKKKILRIGMAAVALSVVLLGCQSFGPGTPGNSIQTEQTGLAPNGDKQHATIDFSLLFANGHLVRSWKVEMVTGSSPQKQWSGDAFNLPTTLTWDGRTEAGSLAPEGTYIATLTVSYFVANPATTQSNSFILDVSPPTGSLTFNPGNFAPDSSGTVQPVTISIKGSSAVAKMDSWSLDILDQDGKSFRSFDGKWPSTDIQWNGKSSNGDWVAPAQPYIAEAILRDEFGNSAQVTSAIAVSELPQPVKQAAAPVTFSVTPGSGGFSPTGDKVMDTMKLALSYGPRESVNAWKLEILDSGQHVQKTLNGDGSKLSSTLSWDGKSDAGTLAQEGKYTARLSVDYGSAFKPGTTTSTPFVLDITPPTGSITLSDPLFSPIEASPTITLRVDASSRLAKIDSWRMEIYDPENHLFRSFDSKWPTQSAVWDGKGFKGDFVLSAEDYPVLVQVRDEFGNMGQLKSVVPVDILMEKTPTGFRILSSRIFFKAYTADYQDVRPELAEQNNKRLADMAAKLKKFPNYRVRLVGHAVMIHWDNKALGNIEQRDELLPLSRARAEAVKKALVSKGLESFTFTTEGVGASDQLVPDSDLADRWQNRRVAFFLDK
jgi:outer membrane protein OmpA-like peptidoglycan-associated protein/flagellar hook assembly protein FlgD